MAFFSLLCNYFSVVALISCFPPLSVPHISREQTIRYGGDQIRENQQQVKTALKKKSSDIKVDRGKHVWEPARGAEVLLMELYVQHSSSV